MSNLLYIFLAIFGIPAGLAWVTRKVLSKKSRYLSLLIITGSAAVPNFWIFYATQQADGITRASSLVVVPFLFVFSLFAASFGYALADLKSAK